MVAGLRVSGKRDWCSGRAEGFCEGTFATAGA